MAAVVCAARAGFYGWLAGLPSAADEFHGADDDAEKAGYAGNPVRGAGAVTELVILIIDGGAAPAGEKCPAGDKQHPARACFAVDGAKGGGAWGVQ